MEYYLPLKLLHIISATILFGTGLGTAFYMWRADKSSNLQVIATTSRQVVLADYIFTVPSVVIQPISGLAMVYLAGIPITTFWVLWSLILYFLVGMLWLPVVWIQLQVAKKSAEALIDGGRFDYPHRLYMRWWYSLGWPAFVMVMYIMYLMVFKPIVAS